MHRTANTKTRKTKNISTFFKFLKIFIILIDSSKPTLFFNFEKTVVSCFFHSTTSLFHGFLSLTITVLTRVLCRFVTIIRDHGIGSRGVLNPYTSRSPLLVLFHMCTDADMKQQGGISMLLHPGGCGPVSGCSDPVSELPRRL